MDLTGKTLGQFHILEPLGQGGMAAVYKAYQPSLDRYVAIKVLPAQHALTPGFSERFVREARAIAQLSHPNILPVIDFGQEGDLSFIVMKFVPAGTLKDRMGHPLALEQALRYIEGVAAALDHAHRRGILHRDVKPSNVLLDEGDWVLLADFGLAKMVAGDEGLTGTGVGIGTPAYMSPEQGRGETVDVYTDIYALGVILYEMVTGRLPFDAETPLAIVMKHITEPPPLPRKFRPDLPEAVERVILKATAKTPQDRYASAGDLAQALRAALAPSPPARVAAAADKLAALDLSHLYTRALGYFYTEQWAKAIEALEAIVAAAPDYERGDASRRLEEADKQQRLADLYAQAQAAVKREDWTAAIGCLNEIVSTAPDYRNAQALLRRAGQQRDLANLYGDARRLYDSGQWQAVLNVWERIRALDADYPDSDALLRSAQAELERERAEDEARRLSEEREQYLADLYRRGLDQVTAGDWIEAVAILEELQTLEPNYQETPGLLERARREIAQQEAAAPAAVSMLPSSPPAPATPIGASLPSVRRKLWPWAVGGVGVGVVLIVVLVLILSGGKKPSAPASGEITGEQAAAQAMQGIVFVSNRDGHREVYRLDEAETVRWTYSPDGSESWSPALLPDGGLVFVSNRDGKQDIYRLDRSGAVARWTYSPGGSESWSPAALPDGALVFVSNRDGQPEVYRMSRSGEVLRWTHSPAGSASWDPTVTADGVVFFVSNRDGRREIYRMEQSGEVLRWTHSPGASESWAPAVTPEGALVFVSNRDGKREIYRMEQSGEVVRWTNSPGDSESWDPQVAADGTLLFTSTRGGKREVFRISRSGEVERITHTPGNKQSWLSGAWDE